MSMIVLINTSIIVIIIDNKDIITIIPVLMKCFTQIKNKQ